MCLNKKCLLEINFLYFIGIKLKIHVNFRELLTTNSTTPNPAVLRASVCNPLEVTAPPKIKPSKLVDNILPIERNVWNSPEAIPVSSSLAT